MRMPLVAPFTPIGDVSASSRFCREDITAPIEMADGHIAVPQAPGLCTPPEAEKLERFRVDRVVC